MSSALRRGHALALLVAAALLLLLARLPPRLSPPQPQLQPQPQPAASATRASSGPPPPPPAPTQNRTVVAPAPAPLANNATGAAPRAVMLREVYVAGHEVAHPELCPALGARLRLLILVSSAPSHAAARQAVRLTWGHYAARSDVALAFVLGQPPAALRPALTAEDALYGDLVIGRSVDSYSNLTLKTLSMLEWADAYCARAPRLLKTDDDMFINVPRLLEFAAAPARANASLTIWGKVVRKWLPKRAPSSKYYVSPLQFPAAVFPDFATGPAYLVTRDAWEPLARAAHEERYVRLEDVFVTGVAAQRAGVRRVHAPEFYNRKVAPHACAVRRGFAIHMVRYHEQFDLWKKLLDGTSKCPS